MASDDSLVAAGYALLSERGLDGVTVRAVLARTGVNRRIFYERFSGKDDLLLAVFEYSLRRLADDCRARVAAMSDPLERLKFIVTYIVLGEWAGEDDEATLRRGAALCREHMRLADARPDELRRVLRPLIELLSEHLSAAINMGRVRPRSPERLANLVYNLVSTTMHAELLREAAGISDGTVTRVELAEDIWDFCLGGLAAR